MIPSDKGRCRFSIGYLRCNVAERGRDRERALADLVDRVALRAMHAHECQPSLGGGRLRRRRIGRPNKPASAIAAQPPGSEPGATFNSPLAPSGASGRHGVERRHVGTILAPGRDRTGHEQDRAVHSRPLAHIVHTRCKSRRTCGSVRRISAGSSSSAASRRLSRSAESGHLPASARSSGALTPMSWAIRSVSLGAATIQARHVGSGRPSNCATTVRLR